MPGTRFLTFLRTRRTPAPRPDRSPLSLALLGCLLASAAVAQAQQVEVSGGRDASGQFYNWQIRNLSESPIVRIEIPHYKADQFTVPAGWEADRENLQGIPGVTSASGVCKAWTHDVSLQVTKGRSLAIQMRINNDGVYRGRGEITVEFADGSRVRVGDVDLPLPPSQLEKLATPIGMGVLVLLFVLISLRRKGKARPEESAPDAR